MNERSRRRPPAERGVTIRGDENGDEVTTVFRFAASPEQVWESLMFYEDVPRRPWPLLRWLLPRPIRSEGDKLAVGGLVRCTYERGYLVKRAVAVSSAQHLRFEVVEQRLGIESYAMLVRGAYEFCVVPEGTEVALTTHYRGRLRPRGLWRLLESHLCHRVHRHILRGMRDKLAAPRAPLEFATFAGQDAPRIAASENR